MKFPLPRFAKGGDQGGIGRTHSKIHDFFVANTGFTLFTFYDIFHTVES